MKSDRNGLEPSGRPAPADARCIKCHSHSGDNWTQCGGVCPVVGSPHFDSGWEKRADDLAKSLIETLATSLGMDPKTARWERVLDTPHKAEVGHPDGFWMLMGPEGLPVRTPRLSAESPSCRDRQVHRG